MLWFEGQPELDMDSDGYSHLPPRERAERYRKLAADARAEAERVIERQALHESYIIIAKRWEDMALDIERRLARSDRWEV
jgi:hypothetical protein